jgi:methionyl-tRNA formyltransferase
VGGRGDGASARPRALFFGTPAFAVPSLDALCDVADVVRVFTQPDRPQGRGQRVAAPPVKERALSRGLTVEQPAKVRTPDFAASLRALEADVALVVAYGRILPRAVLDAPRRGCLNVHASLLPRWRGAAPVAWAVAHGDRETGVCLMQMDEGMDTGPVLACARTAIDPDETAGDLSERLSRLGGEVVRVELARFLAGELPAVPQATEGVTMAPLLEKEHGRIDFARPARAVHDHVRGMSPWPGAFATLAGERIKVHRTRVVDEHGPHGAPGTVLPGLHVACGEGRIAIESVQRDGGKRLAADAFRAGQRLAEGARFE